MEFLREFLFDQQRKQVNALTEWQLDLSYNYLEKLPVTLNEMRSLTRFILRQNHLQAVPPELCNLTKLEEVDLSHNKLETLPIQLGTWNASLRELDLSHNKLSTVPMVVRNFTKLDYF